MITAYLLKKDTVTISISWKLHMEKYSLSFFFFQDKNDIYISQKTLPDSTDPMEQRPDET